MGVLFGLWLLCVYFFIRNLWCYRVRINLIWDDYEAYKRLPSYTYMVFGFSWNVEDYIKE